MSVKQIEVNFMDQPVKNLLETIGRILREKGESIAVAESVTSGLLQFYLSSADRAMQFYQGGITVYNLAQKFKHLQVEPIHAQSVNCVSPRVATQMALHVCNLFSSDWGIGITGYASPVPESGNKTYAYYCITYKGKVADGDMIEVQGREAGQTQSYFADAVVERLHSLVG